MSEQVTHKIPVWESTVAPSPKEIIRECCDFTE